MAMLTAELCFIGCVEDMICFISSFKSFVSGSIYAHISMSMPGSKCLCMLIHVLLFSIFQV